MATQKEVTRKAFQNAAALIETYDLEQLFGDPDTWNAIGTEDQLDKAQREVVAYLQKRATK